MEQCVNCQSVYELHESDSTVKNALCSSECENEYKNAISKFYVEMDKEEK